MNASDSSGSLKLTYVNFGWGPNETFKSVDDALKRARKAGFQSRIEDHTGSIVGTWCPISGFKKW